MHALVKTPEQLTTGKNLGNLVSSLTLFTWFTKAVGTEDISNN